MPRSDASIYSSAYQTCVQDRQRQAAEIKRLREELRRVREDRQRYRSGVTWMLQLLAGRRWWNDNVAAAYQIAKEVLLDVNPR